MSTTLTCTLNTTNQAVDTQVGQIQVVCSGPTPFGNQTVSPGQQAVFSNAAGIEAGTYTVTATTLDVNGNQIKSGGVLVPPATATVQISAIMGPVVTSISIAVS